LRVIASRGDQADPVAGVHQLAVEIDDVGAVALARGLEHEGDVMPSAFGDRSEETIAPHGITGRPEPALESGRLALRFPELEAEGDAFARVAPKAQDRVFGTRLSVDHRLDVEGEGEGVFLAVPDLDDPFFATAAVAADDQPGARLVAGQADDCGP